MKRHKLENGLTVLTEKSNSKLTTVHITVKAGSVHEPKSLSGICHFIEHLVFDGTKKRTAMQISSEIEGIGGEISAYTSNEKTCFFVRAPNKHIKKAIDVLYDITANSTFTDEFVEKERKIIISEIAMRKDQPRWHQFDMLLSALYKKHPAGRPIAGTVESVSRIKREDIVNFHRKYYLPNNMIVTVVGDTRNVLKLIKEKFLFKKKDLRKASFPKEPKLTSIRKKIEKRKMDQSYVSIGFHAVKKSDKDYYAMEVIRSIVGRPLSGRLFEEFRVKRALAYDVGAHLEEGIDFGFFMIYFSTQKKDVLKCRKLALDTLRNCHDISDKELRESKNFLEGEFLMTKEDSTNYAEEISEWEYAKKAEESKKFVSMIKKVTKEDIKRVIKKYLSGSYALAMILEEP